MASVRLTDWHGGAFAALCGYYPLEATRAEVAGPFDVMLVEGFVNEGVAEIARLFGLDADSLTCAFGETNELLAAVPEPGRFSVIGRCEEGEGVLFLSDGEPVELHGWDHFR